MSKTVEQSIAQLLYRQVAGRDEPGDNFFDLLGPFVETEFGLRLDPREFGMLMQRVRSHPEYQQQNRILIDKWRGVLGNVEGQPTAAQSTAFIHDLLASPIREMLFAHSTIAGATTTEPGGLLDTITRHDRTMPSWTLHLTTNGNAEIYGKNRITDIGRGDLVLFKPDADCHYQRHPDCIKWVHLWALFQPRSQWLDWLAWPELDDGVFCLQGADKQGIEGPFNEVVAIGSGGTSLAHELQMNLLEQIIIRAQTLIPRETDVALDPRIRCACGYIRKHLSRAFSVDDIASHCNLSPSHLSHLFKEQTGISPKRWRDDLRLLEARKLLAEPQHSITSIAEKIGYSDPIQFSKLFRKKMGCSPSEFRKM